MQDHSNLTAALPHSLLSDEVAEFIKREIMGGRLRPGDHLVEADFAERLQISKSPVREAFRLLEAEGLVVSYPHRGSFVARLGTHDLWELDSLRALVEPFAAQLAVKRIDDEGLRSLERLVDAMGHAADETTLSELHASFHRTLTGFCGHKRIIDILDGLWAQMSLLLALSHFGHLDKNTIEADHRVLLEAIKARDAARTHRLSEEHVYRTLPGLMESLHKGQP